MNLGMERARRLYDESTILISKHRYKRAIKKLEECLTADCTLALAHIQVAALYSALGFNEKAIGRLRDCWERAFRLGRHASNLNYTDASGKFVISVCRWHVQYGMAVQMLRVGADAQDAMGLLCAAHTANPTDPHIRAAIAERSGPTLHPPLHFFFYHNDKVNERARCKSRIVVAKRAEDDVGMHAFPEGEPRGKLLVATINGRSFYKLQF